MIKGNLVSVLQAEPYDMITIKDYAVYSILNQIYQRLSKLLIPNKPYIKMAANAAGHSKICNFA